MKKIAFFQNSLYQAASDLYTLTRDTCQSKGDRGRIAVVGGSLEYTGAPYFVARASEKAGADIVHVFCHPAAAIAIKSYSPTLIVHPIFSLAPWTADERETFIAKLSFMHVVVLGPGLGKDNAMSEVAETVISLTHTKNIWLVVDADGFRLHHSLVLRLKDHSRCVMTPNLKELQLLERAIESANAQNEEKKMANYTFECDIHEDARLTGALLPSRMKSERDIIVVPNSVILGVTKGCIRRCGGQGDLLAGTIAASLGATPLVKRDVVLTTDCHMSKESFSILLASCVLRDAARYAEDNISKYILATDILNEIHPERLVLHCMEKTEDPEEKIFILPFS